MEIKVLQYTDRPSKKGGQGMKLPLTACSGAYHRGPESKMLSTEALSTVVLWLNKNQEANPYWGMNLANKHKKKKNLSSYFIA